MDINRMKKVSTLFEFYLLHFYPFFTHFSIFSPKMAKPICVGGGGGGGASIIAIN